MRRFNVHREFTRSLFNICFNTHGKSNDTLPKDCPSCLEFLEHQEQWYLEACSEIRAAIKELEQHTRDYAIRPELIPEHASDGTRQFNPNGVAFCELNVQRLEVAEGMLQTLYIDAELAKGWPRSGNSVDISRSLSQAKKTEPDEVKNEGPGNQRHHKTAKTIRSTMPLLIKPTGRRK
ncbi:hypothetical protein E4T39_04744 [Aureobasidium subglaciale]|nr:hypothetical protein E4T39_04744 [Aureobasidium subglaciale]